MNPLMQDPAMMDGLKSSREGVRLEDLIEPGVIGFYNHVEVTEVVAFRGKEKQPVNVLTLLVAEDREGSSLPSDAFLNDKPIRIPSLTGWYFGVYRYFRTIGAAVDALNDLTVSGLWTFSGNSVLLGRLISSARVVVPADTYVELPWNKVLKNNFWNGSYVYEWHDAVKSLLDPLFAKPRTLQELTEGLRPYAPISLATLSDRLGNVLLQLPCDALMARFAPSRSSNEMNLQLGWHPRVDPRPIRALTMRNYDGVLAGLASQTVTGDSASLSIPDGPGDHVSVLWDDTRQIILSVTGPSAFISVINMNLMMIGPEPRIFNLDVDGAPEQQRVQVYNPMPSQVGKPLDEALGPWTSKRIYRDEVARLTARRQFVQYKPTPATQDTERKRALSDVRFLIHTHGEKGAYLWDPYLSAIDILQTLFFCPAHGADLRALTAIRLPTSHEGDRAKETFINTQRQSFSAAASNFLGLRIEYRGRVGSAGWDFHDRFLIFPGTQEGPSAWSLGTSINSLGKQHHILQRVGDGQLIADAFLELWDELDQPQHLIWKNP